MVVIYAEKSSLAKAIAEVLGAGKRIPLKDAPTVGHYEFQFNGENAILCHGVGHLMQLVPAKSYDEKYAKWDLSVFPCIPEAYRIAPKSATKACAQLIKSFLQKADWVINATDPDREGELIFSYVYQACGCRAPYKRVWIEDLTEAKITAAFANLIEPTQAISEQHSGTPDDLQRAGRARDIADWLIGNNLTVAATKQFGSSVDLMSVGRVQTPTLALIVDREHDIRNFVKKPYWKLIGSFTTASGETFEAEYTEGKFDSEEAAKAMLQKCGDATATVSALETKHRTESAPLLYNATQLQIAASDKFDWDSDKTAETTEQIYLDKIASYPRTSSEHLTEAMIPEVTLTLQKIMQMPEYAQYALPEDQWLPFGKRHFNDKKVGSHPAIIPTVRVPENTSSLSDDEKQLYDLLVKSLLRIVYPKAELDDTTAQLDVNGVPFKATGSVITENGWYAVDAMPEGKKLLPTLSEGDTLSCKLSIKQGETEPPKRYTEATLLAAMELAGQKIEDEETRTLMKLQKKGLGTDATRAPIIKGLFAKDFLKRKGKSILPTEKGMFLIDTLPIAAIKSADMTGEWEMRLNEIAMGRESYDSFIREIEQTTQQWFGSIAQTAEHHYTDPAIAELKCPICGKPIQRTKFGYGCTGYSKGGNGCGFAVSSPLCEVKLSAKIMQQLCEQGRTEVINGFVSKKGNSFSAALVLDRENSNVRFELHSADETDMLCPICGKPIRKTKFGYGCTGYSKDGNGCNFSVFSEIAGKKLTASQVKMLLSNGRTGLIKGFHKKNDPDETFDAILVVDKAECRIRFEFPKSKK